MSFVPCENSRSFAASLTVKSKTYIGFAVSVQINTFDGGIYIYIYSFYWTFIQSWGC